MATHVSAGKSTSIQYTNPDHLSTVSNPALLEPPPPNYGSIPSLPTSPSSNTTPTASPTSSEPVRTYWYRWGVLGIFTLNLVVSNFLWITFAPIADVLNCYYGITNEVVNTLSLVGAILALILVMPGSWLLIRYGIRYVTVLSSALNALGGALRVMGAWSGFFSLLIVGQIVQSFCGLMAGSFTLFSEAWFPSSERATATAAAALAPQVGVLLGYGLSPTVIHSEATEAVCYTNSTYTPSPSPELAAQWTTTIYSQIFYYLLAQALFSILTFFITLAGFLEAPPSPPSLSRKLESESHTDLPLCQQLKTFLLSLLQFLKNGYFVLFLISAGIHIGTSGAVGSLVNEIVLPHFPGKDRMIAYLGITMDVCSIVGLFTVGRLLDWTRAFYGLWIGVYVMTALSLATFAVLVRYQSHTYPLYIAIAFVGASFSSFQVVALEYAVEMTYPLPEGTSSGLLNLVAMGTATTLIVVFGRVSSSHLEDGTWVIVGLLCCGALVAVFVRPELRRVKIDKHHSTKDTT